MSSAPHLRLVDTETGEIHDTGDCPGCAEARAEAEVWERRVLELERKVKRMELDREAKLRADRNYPAAEALFEEWKAECGHPHAKFDVKRIMLALSAVKRYKDEREKLSLVIGHGRHLAFVNAEGEKYDEFGRLFKNSDEIERRATAYWRWARRNGVAL